jgi:hypothetical protein
MKTLQFERYLFRQLKQEQGESIERFYARLCENIKRCEYSAEEEDNRLKEQIIDKCLSVKLREIALQVNLTLEDLVFTGTTVESDDKARRNDSRPFFNRSFSHRDERRECSRCGFLDHMSSDLKCPALKTRCNACHKMGHYEKMCWEVKYGAMKRTRSESFSDNRNKRNCFDDYYGSKSSGSRDPRNNFKHERGQSSEQFKKMFKIKQEPRSPERRPRFPEKQRMNTEELMKSHDSLLNCFKETAKPPQNLIKCNEVPTKSSTGTSIEGNFYNCFIGGMPAKLIINSNYPTNVMSKETFKKLYNGKYKFFTTDFVPSKVGDFKFSGQFTSKIEINNQIQYISFYVQEGSEDFVSIGKKMAEQLKLVHD